MKQISAHDIAAEVVRLLREEQTFATTFDKNGAARYLQCSVSKLEMRMRAKEIPFSRDGRTVVFRRKHLDEYLERKRTGQSIHDVLNEILPGKRKRK